MPTKISWTDETWNPTVGCARVSPGCVNCYAEHAAAMVNRTQGERSPYRDLIKLTRGSVRDPKWNGRAKFLPDRLAVPLGWRKPRRVFVDSMSDLFHDDITNEQIAAVFGAMAGASQHTFQVLTKRPRRMREWFRWAESADIQGITCTALDAAGFERGCGSAFDPDAWPLPNVWLGVSVENQDAADERIPLLLKTPAAVRFLSCEPLLEQVDVISAVPSIAESLGPLGWLIAGCESGHGARPCAVDWLRSLRDQCKAAEVPFFLKQAVQSPITFGTGGVRLRNFENVSDGPGSHRKGGGVIELPYLDGVQHAAFPEVTRG